MEDYRKFQRHICETFAVLEPLVDVVTHALEGWDIRVDVAGNAAKDAAATAARIVAGEAAEIWVGMMQDEVWNGFKIEITKVIKQVAQAIMGTPGHYRAQYVAAKAVRASIRYAIANEEMTYSIASSHFQSTMPILVNRRDVISSMLGFNLPSFKRMNLGGQCWYFSRIWGSILLMKPVYPEVLGECKKKFFDVAESCDDPAISSFVSWMTGIDCPRAEFLKRMREYVRVLPRPLACIVYDYLAAPPAHLLKRDILSRI